MLPLPHPPQMIIRPHQLDTRAVDHTTACEPEELDVMMESHTVPSLLINPKNLVNTPPVQPGHTNTDKDITPHPKETA